MRSGKGKAPTIADVAKLAGYSPMTVSRVINGESRVKLETRENVMAAVRQLNYAPNSAARSLAGGDQLRVALVFDNPSASYLSELLLGALEKTSRSNIHLEVHRCENMSLAPDLITKLAKNGTDGFILPPPLCDDQQVVDLANELGVVAVAVGPGKVAGTHAAVLIDDFNAARDMTTHIIEQGHQRIGFITGNPEQVASERRLSGYLEALQRYSIERADELIVQGRFTYRSGLAAAEKLLSLDERPTAIFASNDDMAAAAVAVAHREGLDVPSDISICGFDDTEMASTIWPELTTIRQPIREMTAWAVEAAVKVLRAQRSSIATPALREEMPYQLIKRDSDAAPSLLQQIKD
jgi:LacI family transcriptional regulator